MTKQEVKEVLKGQVIAVIRNESISTAKAVCKALIEEGITTLEITFSVREAGQLIHELREECPKAIIGAGTVLNVKQAEEARNNGAMFIVSPCIVEEVGAYCKEHEILCSLGAATPTEVYKAYQLGCEIVKLFPGDCVSSKMIKGVKAPMPFIEMMPTGGVDDTNINDWFDAGAYAVGLGGYLTKGVDNTNLDVLRGRCRKLLAAYRGSES